MNAVCNPSKIVHITSNEATQNTLWYCDIINSRVLRQQTHCCSCSCL